MKIIKKSTKMFAYGHIERFKTVYKRVIDIVKSTFV